MSQLFYPGERAPQYTFNRRLGQPPGPVYYFGEEKELLPLPEIEPQIIQPVVW
jgi:hypothetical protein